MESSLQQIELSDLGESIGTPPSARLIESVERYGVMQPIVVAKTVDGSGEIGLEVIDGNRRIAAAREARVRAVPALVLDGLTDQQIAEWTLVANGFRQANYLTEMQALRQLQATGYSPSDIAKVSGLAKSSLDVRSRLERLIPRLFGALRAGRITQADAVTASKLDSDDQQQLNHHLERTGSLKRADIMRMYPELAKKSDTSDDAEMQQPTMSTLQNLLLEIVSIAGRLEVSREQLQEMLASTWDAHHRHLE